MKSADYWACILDQTPNSNEVGEKNALENFRRRAEAIQQDALRKEGDVTCPPLTSVESKTLMPDGSSATEDTKVAICPKCKTPLRQEEIETPTRSGVCWSCNRKHLDRLMETNDDKELLDWLEKSRATVSSSGVDFFVQNFNYPTTMGQDRSLRTAIRNAMKETK